MPLAWSRQTSIAVCHPREFRCSSSCLARTADGSQAVGAAREQRPDVVIMDLNMPAVGEVDASLQLMRMEESPRIPALTPSDTDGLVLQALHAGAAGFLLMDLSAGDLTAAVRTAAAAGTDRPFAGDHEEAGQPTARPARSRQPACVWFYRTSRARSRSRGQGRVHRAESTLLGCASG
ncbi:DNA-binding response regulator [Streptomyces sp. AcE210]|nr:DNA-binding response regulator [Streptomyces sp. AcE210]